MINFLDTFLDRFGAMRPVEAAAWAWAWGANVLMFFVSLVVGHLLVRAARRRPVTPPPDPLEWREVFWAAVCVVLNGLVAFAGWVLWRAGVIHIRHGGGWRLVLDVVVLLVAMDFLMYVLHRLAHIRWVYPLAHATHHLYDRPRPLNLFVLSPFEVLGFGALWLALITVYSSTWTGMLTYLGLNLAFGTLGHLGVEPFPRSIGRWPLLRHVGSSTFHANHHQDGAHNFGFYTDVWDRLFGTLRKT